MVEAIPLERLHADGGLDFIFEIDEAEKIFSVTLGSFGDQSGRDVAGIRPENVGHLSLGGVSGDS